MGLCSAQISRMLTQARRIFRSINQGDFNETDGQSSWQLCSLFEFDFEDARMRQRPNYLFTDGDLGATLDAQRQNALRSVEQIPKDQFLSTTIDTLVEHLVQKHAIEPLVVSASPTAMDQRETKVNVTGRFEYGGSLDGREVYADGHELTFFLPFTGEAALWNLRPNSWSSMLPIGMVDARQSVLKMTIVNTSNTEAAWYQQELQSQLTCIRQYVSAQLIMISAFNQALPTQIRSAIEQRRAQIEKLQGLAGAFGIPLLKKSGMPEFRPIEVVKRIPRPLPRPSAAGYKPEPAIAEATYEELLAIIRHAGASFEGAPQTYKPLGEEGLRDNVLSHINVVFEGKATGETFRKYGKTDIRLEEESRSAFVGECKLWGGEKVLVEALTQLMGYLTWRDCKAALILFNKDVAGFSAVQATIVTALTEHPSFLRAKETGTVGEWRYVFQSAEDSAREVTVHVFAFNLYVAPERATKRR